MWRLSYDIYVAGVDILMAVRTQQYQFDLFPASVQADIPGQVIASIIQASIADGYQG